MNPPTAYTLFHALHDFAEGKDVPARVLKPCTIVAQP